MLHSNKSACISFANSLSVLNFLWSTSLNEKNLKKLVFYVNAPAFIIKSSVNKFGL